MNLEEFKTLVVKTVGDFSWIYGQRNNVSVAISENITIFLDQQTIWRSRWTIRVHPTPYEEEDAYYQGYTLEEACSVWKGRVNCA